MQVCEIDRLGRDELIARSGSEIVDIFNEKGIGEGMLGQQDELGAAGGEIGGDGGADAGGTAGEDADFAVEEAGGGIRGALEVGFEDVEDSEGEDKFEEEGEERD
jgi:hypothetical protein